MEVLRLTCYAPVELLRVSRAYTFDTIRLLPLDDARLPPEEFQFTLGPPVGSVAATEVSGTNYGRMQERAARRIDHGLRALRVALRSDHFVHDRQLRFRRGPGFSFGAGAAGWKIAPDSGWELTLDEKLYEGSSRSGVRCSTRSPASGVSLPGRSSV